MAGKDNLVANENRTPEERRKNASAAGKASGEARRKKRAMKSAAKLLLDMGASDETAVRQMRTMGLEEEEMTNQMAVVAAMLRKALKGNVKAAAFLRDLIGESPAAEIRRAELKLRREEFKYRKERDAESEMTELEDLQSVEALIYGADSDTGNNGQETPDDSV